MTEVPPVNPGTPEGTPPVAPPVAPAAAPAYAAPAAPQYAGAPQYAAPAAAVPGKTLGIVALILAILPFQLIGLILGIVALSQSRKVGAKNTPAFVAIIVAIVLGLLSLIILGVTIAGFVALASQCAGLEPGVYQLDNGGTISCNV